ncbi:MAG: lytic transglycosylase domain-containing protein [Oligoflexia bacterium]|nr:lytic transglycosylase domain-containing protein [Oligoflexia bacterium]
MPSCNGGKVEGAGIGSALFCERAWSGVSLLSCKLVVCGLSLLLCGCSNLGLSPAADSGPLGFISGLIQPEDERASLVMPSQRAKQLPDLPIIVNSEVRRELSFLLRHECAFVRGALERRRELYPVLAQILDDEGVSRTFLNVALIESGFKINARSYAGAVGLWQFMRSTARLYGLRVTKRDDQRRDPILATIAAARHFRDLYRLYGDWYLALAAYNAGTGSVERAMRRAKSSDFWTIAKRRALKNQTVRYVPRIIAASIIVHAFDSQPDRDPSEVLAEIEQQFLFSNAG